MGCLPLWGERVTLLMTREHYGNFLKSPNLFLIKDEGSADHGIEKNFALIFMVWVRTSCSCTFLQSKYLVVSQDQEIIIQNPTLDPIQVFVL